MLFPISLTTESSNGWTSYGVKILETVVNAINTSDGSLLPKSLYKVATNNNIIGESSPKNREAAK